MSVVLVKLIYSSGMQSMYSYIPCVYLWLARTGDDPEVLARAVYCVIQIFIPPNNAHHILIEDIICRKC